MSDLDQTVEKRTAAIKVTVLRGEANKKEFTFSEPFMIGREDSCAVRFDDTSVSRSHAEVYLREGSWWIRDLNSANGVLVEGQKVDRLPLGKRTSVEFGVEGPVLSFEPEIRRKAQATVKKIIPSVTQYQKRYFDRSGQGEMGEHTLFIRQAFQRVQKKQKGRYFVVIGLAAALILLAVGYAYLQHRRVAELRQEAVASFYRMKEVEVRISHLSESVQDLENPEDAADLERSVRDLRRIQDDYDAFLSRLGVYKKKISDDERLIMKVARIFGECDLTLPPAFVAEVRKYIQKWQRSNRLARGIQRATERGYHILIPEELRRYGLPPQLFYLALQESEFDPNACGPKTRFGFAKGMWQFIPITAQAYGLRTGPLEFLREYDPRDERHDVDKSTRAAARYLRDLYNRDAQGSALLVMASYNWSERRVRDFITTLPENPKERNFWLLLERYVHRIPNETYDYVFYIFSAAVIGEDPRLFGFDFDPPLGHIH